MVHFLPSVTPYASLFCLSTLVYLQHIHVYLQFSSTRSTSIIMFSLLNTLIHIVLSIPHHLTSYHNILQQLCMHCCYTFGPAFVAAARCHWLFPASFFALSPRLTDRSRRKTLHTLQQVQPVSCRSQLM